jgi:hypothetical protein
MKGTQKETNRGDLGILFKILYICILSHIATSLSLFFPSFVRLIDVFNTLLVFSTLNTQHSYKQARQQQRTGTHEKQRDERA